MTNVHDAVALVTGGQRGLGQALTTALLKAGASKVYVTARDPRPDPDPRIVPVRLEVTDRGSIHELAAQTGDVSILVNNAGGIDRAALIDVSDQGMQHVFDINVFGLLRVSQEFAPILAAHSGGALVNILSVHSFTAGAGVYGASKAAAWSITNSLRGALAEQGTQVLGANLSYTATDMTRDLDVVKHSPDDIARRIIQALQAGAVEVLLDESSRAFKAALSGPVQNLQLRLVDGELQPTPA